MQREDAVAHHGEVSGEGGHTGGGTGLGIANGAGTPPAQGNVVPLGPANDLDEVCVTPSSDPTPGSKIYVKGSGPAVVVASPGGGARGRRFRVRLLSLSGNDAGAALAGPHGEGGSISVGRDRILTGQELGGSNRLEFLQTPANDSSRKTNSSAAIFTLVSTILGGGVLSLPFALDQCGLVFGGLVLIISALMSGYTADLLILSSRTVGKDTFEQVALRACGGRGQVLTVCLLFALTFLAAVGYIVLIGDLLVPILQLAVGHSISPWMKKLLLSGIILLVLPACCSRSLHSLRFLSVFSFFSVLLCAICIAVHSVQTFGIPHTVWTQQMGKPVNETYTSHLKLWPTDWFGALYAYPIFGVAFLCHFNALPVHSELAHPTRTNSRFVVTVTMTLACLVYLAVGFFGVTYAGLFTCGNILLNFAADDMLITVCRASLTIVLTGTFPLFILPCRSTVHRLIIYLRQKKTDSTAADLAADESGPAATTAAATDSLKDPLLSAGSSGSSSTLDGAVIASSLSTANPANNTKYGDGSIDPGALKKSNSLVHVYRSRLRSDVQYTTIESAPETEDGMGSPGAARSGSGMVYVDSFRRHAVNKGPLQDVEPEGATLYMETVLIVLCALGVALNVKGILIVWTLLGSTVSSVIGFILPAIFFIRIRSHESDHCQKGLAWAIMIFSIFMSLLCTVLALMSLNVPACPVVIVRDVNAVTVAPVVSTSSMALNN